MYPIMKTIIQFLVLVALSCFASDANAKKNVAEELFVYDPAGVYLDYFRAATDLTLDHRNEDGYEVYGPPGTADLLETQNIPFWRQSVPKGIAADYPSSAEIATKIREIVAANSPIMSLHTIGYSTLGQPLLVVKISDNPNIDETEPEVKLISSMHGNEIVGRDVLVAFLEFLAANYNINDRITNLINNSEIFIMPSMNPDGSDRRQRGNANWQDLNRDFPDFSTNDNENTTENREPETAAIMEFQAPRQFALSANFHGGAEVVNYPWDTTSERHPFDAMIREISLEYAGAVPYMRNSTRFPGGVTNGYDWYTLDGGMQDWSYHWHNDLQVTIEISGSKWPAYSEIPYYFETNRDAILAYLATIQQGAGFQLTNMPNASGTVEIFTNADGSGENLGRYNFHSGEFYKVLPFGEYLFRVEVEGQSLEFSHRIQMGASPENGNFHRLRL